MDVQKNSIDHLRHALRPLLAGIALLTLLISTTTPASAATVHNTHFRGNSVYTYSETYDGCGYGYASLSVSQVQPAPPTLFYYASGYNCTPEGGYYYYCAEGLPTTYNVGGNLSTARVTATVSLTDCAGTSIGQSKNLDVTWTATSPVSKGGYSSRNAVPGYYVESYRVNGKSRSASVSGSITGYGSISTVTSGTHIVSIR